MSEEIIETLRVQARACRALGSPFSADLLELAAGDPPLALFAPWQDADGRRLINEAVALRFLGALHDLVLSGEAPGLAAAYPGDGRPGDATAAWVAAGEAFRAHGDQLARFMEHEPQTNEVRRAVCLLPGFLRVAARHGEPLRCFEIGASAGLNLNWDRFRYDLGGGSWGDPDAAVRLDTTWEGPLPPLGVRPGVVERAGCDRRPVDIGDPQERQRLLAYVWPDQFERLARARAAIATAEAHPVMLEAADARDWVERRVRPERGAATVLYHSVFWQYLSAPDQAALAETIARVAAQATADAPFAWLRMEPGAEVSLGMTTTLTQWPGGETQVLADVHPHGAFIRAQA